MPLKLIAFLLVFADVKSQDFSLEHFRQFDWLEASWKMETSEGARWEIWKKTNDSTFSIKGYRMAGNGDTVLVELISFRLRSGKIYYIPTVPGQNNEQPVPFIITAVSKNSFTAENPRHDFPQKIIYTKRKRNYMVATISGTVNGTERSGVFLYKRQKRAIQ